MIMSTKHPFNYAVFHCLPEKGAFISRNTKVIVHLSDISMHVRYTFIAKTHLFISLFKFRYRYMKKCHCLHVRVSLL